MSKENLFNEVYDTLGDSNLQAIVLHLMSKFDKDVINRYQYAVALLLGNQHPAAHDYVAVFEQEHLWVRTFVRLSRHDTVYNEENDSDNDDN